MSRSTIANSNPDRRGVNSLLHALRGEQFRHSQNLQRSRAHVSGTISLNSPTLPIDFGGPDYTLSERSSSKGNSSHQSAYKKCSGPEPPKSWTLTSREVVEDTPAWRTRALSVVLLEPPLVTPLTTLCLLALATLPAQDFNDIIPYISPHLRRDLIRHAAVHSPLPIAKLYALCEPDGHTDTELLVVGPNAALGDDYFIRHMPEALHGLGSNMEDGNWDSDTTESEPLNTLILMSTRLATSTLLSFPPTVTRMALINISNPIPIHRLPGTCPLLVVLDLSYNTWLSSGAEGVDKILERVEWSRWSRLRVIGLRGCCVSSGIIEKLNKGRWDDVELVQ